MTLSHAPMNAPGMVSVKKATKSVRKRSRVANQAAKSGPTKCWRKMPIAPSHAPRNVAGMDSVKNSPKDSPEQVAGGVPSLEQRANEMLPEYADGLLPCLGKEGRQNLRIPVRYRLNPAHARQPFLESPEQCAVVENLVPRNQGQRMPSPRPQRRRQGPRR